MFGGPSADINFQDAKGYTALHHAAISGNLEMVQLLVQEKKADVTVASHEGVTPLHSAILSNHLDVAQFLIDAGCDLQIKLDGMSILHLAAVNCTIPTLEWLLAGRCEVRALTPVGKTALHVVVMQGKLESVKVLVAAGVDIDAQDNKGNTALHLALFQQKSEDDVFAEIAIFLLEQEASVTLKNAQAESADRIIFTWGDNPHLIQALKEAQTPYDRGFEFLHAVALRNLTAVKQLLAEQVSPHSVSTHQQNALHAAAMDGAVKLVTLLVHNKVEVNLADYQGRTPVFFLKGSDAHILILKRLMLSGAKVDKIDVKGETVVHRAVSNNGNLFMRALMQYQPPLDVQNKDGETALHIAARLGQYADVELLLAQGAATDLQDKEGNTALHVVLRNAQKAPKPREFIWSAMLLLEHDASLTIMNKAGVSAQSIIESDPTAWPVLIQFLMQHRLCTPGQELIFAARLGSLAFVRDWLPHSEPSLTPIPPAVIMHAAELEEVVPEMEGVSSGLNNKF